MPRLSHLDTASEKAMKATALPTIASVSAASPPPPAAKPSTSAITMSSATRMASTRSVSSSARRRKSISPFTVIALEET